MKNTTIVLKEVPRIINNKDERHEIICNFHDDPILGGHTGINRTLCKIKEKYTWPNLKKQVYTYIKNCAKCQLNKKKVQSKEPLILVPTPEEPFHIVQIDTIGPIETSTGGNKYAITIQCELTKYLVAIPVKDKSAETIARGVFEYFILVYGNFDKVKTDLGTEYVNSVFKELGKWLKFHHITSTAHHHQTLGSVERSHRELNN